MGMVIKLVIISLLETTKLMIEENVINFRRHLQMFPFNEHLSNEDKTNHRTFMIEKQIFQFFVWFR